MSIPETFDVRWDRMHSGFCAAVLAGREGRAGDADAAFAIAREAAAVYALHGPLYLRLVAEAALRDRWGDPIIWLMEAANVLHPAEAVCAQTAHTASAL
jgi:hypothetical protein